MTNTNIFYDGQDIVLVYKRSRWSYAKYVKAKSDFAILEHRNDIIAKKLMVSHEKNIKSLAFIENYLKSKGLKYSLICRSKLTKKDTQNKLVIAVGGDGTILDVSHHCKKAIILGVNSDPDNSVGALCVANIENFVQLFEGLLTKIVRISPLARMSIEIDGDQLDILAQNDVLFCHKNPSFMSRYYLNHKNISSEQKSSGVWIATPTGSTGATFSAGGHMEDLFSNRLQFIVREPYSVIDNGQFLLKGVSDKNESIEIKSAITDGMLYVDGPNINFKVPLGSTVRFKISNSPLFFVNAEAIRKRQKDLILNRIKYREKLYSLI